MDIGIFHILAASFRRIMSSDSAAREDYSYWMLGRHRLSAIERDSLIDLCERIRTNPSTAGDLETAGLRY